MRQIIKADSITCSWPKEVSGQTLVEIDYDSLTCDGESMASTGGGQTSHGSNFLLVLLGAMLSVVGYFGFLKFQRYRVQGKCLSMYLDFNFVKSKNLLILRNLCKISHNYIIMTS